MEKAKKKQGKKEEEKRKKAEKNKSEKKDDEEKKKRRGDGRKRGTEKERWEKMMIGKRKREKCLKGVARKFRFGIERK